MRYQSGLELLGSDARGHEAGDLSRLFFRVEHIQKEFRVTEVLVGLLILFLQDFQNPQITLDALLKV